MSVAISCGYLDERWLAFYADEANIMDIEMQRN